MENTSHLIHNILNAQLVNRPSYHSSTHPPISQLINQSINQSYSQSLQENTIDRL